MNAQQFRIVAAKTEIIGATNEIKLLHLILGWLQAEAALQDEVGSLRLMIANEVKDMTVPLP